METGRDHEIKGTDMAALEMPMILDIIDFGGDFETGFIDYTPPHATFFNRGCPEYINLETDRVDPRKRHLLMRRSIRTLERYCNIFNLEKAMIQFYNSISGAVANFKEWPPTFRESTDSLHFYEVLLNSSNVLQVPEEVVQAIRCVLVVPASNADPERSFSAANHLSREERTNMNTETLDHLMTVERNGPSLLTVKPEQLASQWMHPLPGLGIHHGNPSTFQREGSLMKDVKHALSVVDVNALAGLHV